MAYVLDPGDTLAFGDQAKQYAIEFEARGSDSPMLQMLMQVGAAKERRCLFDMSRCAARWVAVTMAVSNIGVLPYSRGCML